MNIVNFYVTYSKNRLYIIMLDFLNISWVTPQLTVHVFLLPRCRVVSEWRRTGSVLSRCDPSSSRPWRTWTRGSSTPVCVARTDDWWVQGSWSDSRVNYQVVGFLIIMDCISNECFYCFLIDMNIQMLDAHVGFNFTSCGSFKVWLSVPLTVLIVEL